MIHERLRLNWKGEWKWRFAKRGKAERDQNLQNFFATTVVCLAHTFPPLLLKYITLMDHLIFQVSYKAYKLLNHFALEARASVLIRNSLQQLNTLTSFHFAMSYGAVSHITELYSSRRRLRLTSRYPNCQKKFGYCPSRTVPIILTFRKHNSLPLGLIWTVISCHKRAAPWLHVNLVKWFGPGYK